MPSADEKYQKSSELMFDHYESVMNNSDELTEVLQKLFEKDPLNRKHIAAMVAEFFCRCQIVWAATASGNGVNFAEQQSMYADEAKSLRARLEWQLREPVMMRAVDRALQQVEKEGMS